MKKSILNIFVISLVFTGCFTGFTSSTEQFVQKSTNTRFVYTATPLPNNISELSSQEFIKHIFAPFKVNNNDATRSAKVLLGAGFRTSNLSLLNMENFSNHEQTTKLDKNNFNELSENIDEELNVTRATVAHLSSYAFTN